MHEHYTLTYISVFLCAAVFSVALGRMLKLSPVVGYLAAGAFLGPFGLGVINDPDSAKSIAEFGVIFMLFLIGLELSLDRLSNMRKHVFGFGGAQVIMTGGIIAAFVFGIGGNATTAFIVGGGLALSSTAVVLQVLQEQAEKTSQVGRLALAVLILQDLAVIPLLVFVSLMGAEGKDLSSIFIDTALNAVLGLIIIFGFGYLLLRPLFRFIASLENTELFTATALLVVVGAATISSMAGLSAELGAFVAGLLIAETEFKPQVESDILPFKGVFLGLFFITVGMSLNIDMLMERFLSIIALCIALMATKALVIMGLCRIFHFALGTAVHVGVLLSQGSEFAFALFTLADNQNALDGALAQTLLVVITVSMTITPLVASFGKRISNTLDKHGGNRADSMIEETIDMKQHIIICGYGRVGHTVAQLLTEEGIGYVAIDMDSLLTSRERRRGVPVYYGDTTRMHVLKALGTLRARAVIVTHTDLRVSLNTISTIRELNPHIPIVVRASNIEQVRKLEAAGANLAVADRFEISLQLGAALLKSVGISELEVSRILDVFRADDYAITRATEK